MRTRMRHRQLAFTALLFLGTVVQFRTPEVPNAFLQEMGWEQAEQRAAEKPKAIFHVGPHKTGTTSIQNVLQPRLKLYANLTQDNYHPVFIAAYPISHRMRSNKNHFVLETMNRTGFLQHMTEHAAQDHNVIVSNEFLGQVYEENHFVWEKFHEVLDLYDTTVVVAYRRLFELSLSYYQEMAEPRARGRKGLPLGFAEELDIQMREAAKMVKNSESPFLVFGGDEFAVHPSMNEKLRYENKGFAVDVFNFHSGPDVVAEFYCKYFGEESHTCLELRSKSTEEKIHKNQRRLVWEYWRLAHAFLTRMAGGNLTRKDEFQKAIQHRQEKELNQTISDFPKTCMSRELADRFLNVSLVLEEEMMPEFYASPRGQHEHREQFEAYFESDQFCTVDIAKVLEEPSWQEYMTAIFQSAEVEGEANA